MNAQPLYLADGREAGAAYCGVCKIIHREVTDAERCCTPRCCADCGARLVHGICQACRVKHADAHRARIRAQDARKFAAANKMYIEDFKEALVYSVEHDRYVGTDELEDLIDESLAEFVERGGKPWEWTPPYVYATYVVQPTIDVDGAIENALDDAFDGALDHVDSKAVAELTEYVDAWSRVNLPKVYYQHDKLALVPWPVDPE